jgi:hypothetical protein
VSDDSRVASTSTCSWALHILQRSESTALSAWQIGQTVGMAGEFVGQYYCTHDQAHTRA